MRSLRCTAGGNQALFLLTSHAWFCTNWDSLFVLGRSHAHASQPREGQHIYIKKCLGLYRVRPTPSDLPSMHIGLEWSCKGLSDRMWTINPHWAPKAGPLTQGSPHTGGSKPKTHKDCKEMEVKRKRTMEVDTHDLTSEK